VDHGTVTGVTYQREPCAAIWDEVAPLLERHWHEVAHYQDIPLAVDRAAYERADAGGFLRCFTARLPALPQLVGDPRPGALIGYAAYLVGPNWHYRMSLQAKQDVVFLAPEHRRGRVALRLLALADEQLKAEGIQAVYHHVKLAHPRLGRLLEHLGYEAVETIWAKRLDR
jgi:GNAT superfamily N-acetyltransferase